MTKKYKCRLSASSLLVNVKGKVLRLEFEADVVSVYGLRGCSYTTDNIELQHAIERSKRFCSKQRDEIWTDDIEESVKKKVYVSKQEAQPVEIKKVTRVRRAKKEA